MASGLIPWLANAAKKVPGVVSNALPPPGGIQTNAPGNDTAVQQQIHEAFGTPPAIDNAIKSLPQHVNIFKGIENALYSPAKTPPTGSGGPGSAITPSGPGSPPGTPGTVGGQGKSQTSAPHDPLTYQQMVNTLVAPLIKQIGAGPGDPSINAALAPYSANGSPSLAKDISTNIQSSISDYQAGLTAMMNTASTADPLQAILAGMKSLITYPQAGLTGQQGAPPGVEQSPETQALYAALATERGGGTPTDTATNSLSSLLSGSY